MSEHESVPIQSIARIDELVQRLESLPDPSARATAVELLQAVMQLHAAAIARMLEMCGEDSAKAMGADDLVSSVLVLHGVHPDDTETRIQCAIEKLQRFFDSRGAGIALSGISDGTVRVRFTSSRPGSGTAARQVIEDAIYEAAPEISGLVIEGVDEGRAPGFVPLSDLVAVQTV